MTLALLTNPRLAAAAAPRIAQRLPRLRIVTALEQEDLAGIQFLAAYAVPAGTFAKLPALRLICSSGAGAETLLDAADLPSGVPLTRVLDPATNAGIVEYVIHMVLRQHRNFAGYEAQQRERRWQRIEAAAAADTCIGVLGLGNLGLDLAQKLVMLGFRVAGWSRTQRHVEGIACYSGEAGLVACLEQSRFLVCLLPLTAATAGILNARRLGTLPRGAYVINVGRGAHLVPSDLLALIDSGHLEGAALDTHVAEPLPTDDPLWSHPRVIVTPHVAAQTSPHALADQLCTNIERLERGLPLLNLVDRARGY